MSVRRCFISLALAVALCASTATRVEANPIDATGFGARAVGMAGANAAVANDTSALHYNPAGIARAEHLRFDIGYVHMEPRLRLNGGDLEVDPINGFQGGLLVPGRIGRRRIAAGVLLHLPAARITRIRALPQSQPRFAIYDNRPQRLVITAGLSFEVLPRLFVGLGMTFLSNTGGVLDISGAVSLSDAERSALYADVDVNLESVRYLSAGIAWQASETLHFGVAFRDEFSLALDLDVRVSGDVFAGDPASSPTLVSDALFLLTLENATLFSPRTLVLGGGFQIGGTLLTADVIWQQWSRYPTPSSAIEIELDLPGLPFAIPPFDVPLDPGFRDIFSVRVGCESRIYEDRNSSVDVRAGYGFEPSPAPDQPGETNYVDSAKHTFGAGLGFRFFDFGTAFRNPLEFGISGHLTALSRRDYEKNNPADPYGDYVAGGVIGGIQTSIGLQF